MDQLRFARESFTDDLIAELMPLLFEHWREIAHYPDIPLKPDLAVYRGAEQAGILRVFTVRSGTTVRHGSLSAQRQQLNVGTEPVRPTHVTRPDDLVGYAIFFVRPNPHYADSVQAVQDILYVQPTMRGMHAGARFIDWCDEQLAAERVQAVYHHVKAAHNFGKLLERKGYELVDLIYAKRLDGRA